MHLFFLSKPKEATIGRNDFKLYYYVHIIYIHVLLKLLIVYTIGITTAV